MSSRGLIENRMSSRGLTAGSKCYTVMDRKGYVYMLSNKTNSVLYVGVTNSLVRRIAEHKDNRGAEFTVKYNCHKLVYYEVFSDIEQAIRREKRLKEYKRSWKEDLINKINPEWDDLYIGMVRDPEL